MVKYTIRRLLQAIPTFFGITILSFLLMANVSGNPVSALTAGNPRITPQQRARLEAISGVNDPWPVQYVRWLLGDDWLRFDSDGDGIADTAYLVPLDADGDGEPEPPGTDYGILRGDFGDSFAQRTPVLQMVTERIAATMELGIASLALALVIGVPTGILAAVRRGGAFDNITRVLAVLFNAVPVFWLGLILILVFGSWLGVLPMGGRCPPVLTGGCPPIYGRLDYLLLPTLVLAVGEIALYSRYMRASTLEIISQDYVRTAQAKGLPQQVVWFNHAARNALIPLATFLGPAITGLLGGAAITEKIFSWPGLGRLAVDSVTSLDYPVVMAVVIMTAIATILGYILSDLLYALIDPRIRFS
ncbi:MAG: ABC transporter permease subunit [Burkholderiales bacterium]|nr:ABC transporter permease subunit [Anaerolineae bacterium]